MDMDEAGRAPCARKTQTEGTRFQRDFGITLVGFPEAILPEMREDVRAVAYLVPAWCTEVTVEWLDVPIPDDGDGTTNIASCSVSYRYRHAAVAIRPIYFSPLTTQEERRANLAHEFVHILLAPLADYGRDRFDDLVEQNTAIKRNIDREWQDRVEAVTSDIAGAVGHRRNMRLWEVPSGAPEQRGSGPAQAAPQEGQKAQG